MITAIVMISCEVDRIPEVAEAIADIPAVSEVYSVTGDADLIAMVRVKAHEEFADVIADRLNKVEGIVGTVDAHRLPHLLPHDLEAAFSLGLEGDDRHRHARGQRPGRRHPAFDEPRRGPRVDGLRRPRHPGAHVRVEVGRPTNPSPDRVSARASPALSSTASRTGPRAPANTSRTTPALCAASPPRSVLDRRAARDRAGPGRRTRAVTDPPGPTTP